MLKNYLKITFRNIVRNKLFTAINILGLSVSIASCLLIFLYVSEQLGYDTQHEGRVYRITSLFQQNSGAEFNVAFSSVPVAPAIEKEIPEILQASRIITTSFTGSKDLISIGTESFYITNGGIADSTIFSLLKYDIKAGDENNLLPNGNSIVLEKEWADKLFGKNNALGKSLELSTMVGVNEYEVTGVYDKHTYNAHFTPNYILSINSPGWKDFIAGLSNQWVGNNLANTYIRISDQASVKDIEEKIDVIFRKNGAEEMKAMGANKIMSLQPVEDIHTSTGFMVDIADVVSKTFIYVLLSIGVLILLLACVNYINLSTAQAGNRSLEVGIRKVMGISAKGLMVQFLGESFIIVFISLLLSILLAELTIPFFNNFVDQPIELTASNFGQVAIYMVGFLFFTAFVAGSYPAIYLASFKPTSVLKGRNKDRGGVAFLRKVLVTFQFVISIVLISSILIISDQVEFIKNKDLGFNSNSKIILPLSTNEDQAKFQLIKKELQGLASVQNVTGAHVVPGMQIANDLLVYKKGQTMDEAVHIFNNDVDIDYVKTLGVKLLSGRDFAITDLQDTISGRVLVNRKAVADLGFEIEEAAGEIIYFDWRGTTYQFKIVGVIEDINQFSLHLGIEPLMLSLSESNFGKIIIDTPVDKFSEATAEIEKVYKKILPETPFESFALNDHLIKQYEADFKTFNLVIYFAFISVFISCMGLYALSMFIAERRFKEIGVRKALGASIRDIIFLVSKDLSLIVLIAFIISIPLSVYGMNKWLNGFAYKITPSVGTYIIAGVISIAIGWITISYQSIRAARTNPVDVLKDE